MTYGEEWVERKAPRIKRREPRVRPHERELLHAIVLLLEHGGVHGDVHARHQCRLSAATEIHAVIHRKNGVCHVKKMGVSERQRNMLYRKNGV